MPCLFSNCMQDDKLIMRKEKALLVGERSSQISFLCSLLDDEKKEEFKSACIRYGSDDDESSAITAAHGEQSSILKKDGNVTLLTPYIPEGTEIELQEELNDLKCDILFLLCSFRFEKNLGYRIKKIAEKLMSDNLSPLRIKAVVFDNPDIHTGSTDLNDPETEFNGMLETIKKEIQKNKLLRVIDVVTYKEKNDFYSLFSGGDKTLCFSSDCLEEHIASLKLKISFYISDSYIFVDNDISMLWEPKLQASITDFAAVRNSRNLFQSYANGFFKSELWEQLTIRLKEEYKNILKKVIFWDIDADWNEVLKRISQKSMDYLMKDREVIGIKSGLNQYDYNELIAREKYDSEFTSGVTNLIKFEIPKMMVDEFNKKLSVFTVSVK